MVLHSIDFKNIIKHPLIKATEYSAVHGGTLIKPAPSSASSVHSTSSISSTASSNSSSPAVASSSSSSLESSYTPVVLKWSRHPDDYRDLLHAYSKIRDNAPNIIPLYGATREPPVSAEQESFSSPSAQSLSSPSSNTPSNNAPAALSTSPTITFQRTRASSGLERVQAVVQSTLSSSLPKSSSIASSIASFQLPEPDETQPRDWLATKPAAHGTLHEFLKTPQGEALSWMDKIRLIRGVASGLKYLHDHDLLHMHLHSDNVLIENGPTALLTDFGQYARSTRGPEETQPGNPRWVSGGGTYEKNLMYTAPERLLNPQHQACTTASDVYSLGVIMLEIMVGSRSLASHFLKSLSSSPETRWNLETTTPWTQHGGTRPSQMAMQLPTAMEGLIRKMLSRDPAHRPGMMVIRSQLKEMANTSFDLHVREPISKGTTSIHLNPKKPISVITTPLVQVEASGISAGPSSAGSIASLGSDTSSQPHSPRSPERRRHRRSVLWRALEMSVSSAPPKQQQQQQQQQPQPPPSPRQQQQPPSPAQQQHHQQQPQHRKQVSIWSSASSKGETRTIWAAAAKGDTKTVQSLLSKGTYSINQRDPATDHTPLLAAVADSTPAGAIPSIALLELLINRGAEINAVDQKTKQTVLHHLCGRPDPAAPALPGVLRFLLERGANPNAVSASRQTPLHSLAEKAKTTSPLEAMRLLMDFGADVNQPGPVLWTALHWLSSSEKPFLDAIMLLLTRDVNVNARDSNQWTALHFVAHYNRDPAPALKMLVDAGADVNMLTKRGEDLVQVLLKAKGIDRLALESFVGNQPPQQQQQQQQQQQTGLTGSYHQASNSISSAVGLGLSLGGNSGGNGGGSSSSIHGGSTSSGSLASGQGSHRRNQSSLSTMSNASYGSMALSLASTAETIMASDPTTAFATTTILSPEEEAKEESLKKLADLIRWLIVDCGLDLDHHPLKGRNNNNNKSNRNGYSQDQEEDDEEEEEEIKAKLMHPKSQHPLMRAVRLGMRPIVSVLLETSLAMSETIVLDCAIRVTEDMMTSLLSAGPLASSAAPSMGAIVPSYHGNIHNVHHAHNHPHVYDEVGGGSGTRSPRQQYHHRAQAGSIGSLGSLVMGSTPSPMVGGSGSTNSPSSVTTASTTTTTATTGTGSNVAVAGMVTPKTVAAASAAAARIREIELLLRIWRSEEASQREDLRAGVAARLSAARAQKTLLAVATEGGSGGGVAEAHGSGSGHSRRTTGTLGRARTNAAGRSKLDPQHQQQQQQQQQQASQGRPIGRRTARDAFGAGQQDSSYGSSQDLDDGSNISVISVEHEVTGLLPGMRSVTM
ncbi:hypothetical protein DFQ27_000497 [Actinomortierella ambigua]|uniref:Protein kinase domain-containing protein n=1 Tax=Actinomortierella ambigua TaxID=1343610 RepID=A0A9P6U9S3_9FUNG|nr:hypothetical protein DFQ27_000497 [Actinomortierella ambigua]